MFSSSNKKLDAATTSTVIGEGIKIEGGIVKGRGNIRIDGEIIALVEIDGSVIVGESGRITGDVKVEHALVAGKIDGNVTCSASLHLSPTSALNGNITVGSLIIDEGARFAGSCQMSDMVSENRKNKRGIVEVELAE